MAAAQPLEPAAPLRRAFRLLPAGGRSAGAHDALARWPSSRHIAAVTADAPASSTSSRPAMIRRSDREDSSGGGKPGDNAGAGISTSAAYWIASVVDVEAGAVKELSSGTGAVAASAAHRRQPHQSRDNCRAKASPDRRLHRDAQHISDPPVRRIANSLADNKADQSGLGWSGTLASEDRNRGGFAAFSLLLCNLCFRMVSVAYKIRLILEFLPPRA